MEMVGSVVKDLYPQKAQGELAFRSHEWLYLLQIACHFPDGPVKTGN